jgi:hypothetical protein
VRRLIVDDDGERRDGSVGVGGLVAEGCADIGDDDGDTRSSDGRSDDGDECAHETGRRSPCGHGVRRRTLGHARHEEEGERRLDLEDDPPRDKTGCGGRRCEPDGDRVADERGLKGGAGGVRSEDHRCTREGREGFERAGRDRA